MNLFRTLCFVLVALGLASAFVVYPMLPASVPIHWNAAGEIDGYGPNWVGAFMFPLIMAFTLMLFYIIPKIAVFKENLQAFEKQYWILGALLELFFLFFFVISLLPNFGIQTGFRQLFILPLAMLFIVLGFLMPGFKRNFFVGIRTPWTLANEEVWEKTHALGGKLFIAAGILTLLGAFLPENSVLLSVGVVLVAAIAAVVYSFLLYRKIGKGDL